MPAAVFGAAGVDAARARAAWERLSASGARKAKALRRRPA